MLYFRCYHEAGTILYTSHTCKGKLHLLLKQSLILLITWMNQTCAQYFTWVIYRNLTYLCETVINICFLQMMWLSPQEAWGTCPKLRRQCEAIRIHTQRKLSSEPMQIRMGHSTRKVMRSTGNTYHRLWEGGITIVAGPRVAVGLEEITGVKCPDWPGE